MKKKQSITTGVLLIAAIVVVVNVLSYSYFFRLDFTKDKRYTLSPATVELLKNLKQPVTVTAYFSENMPPQIEEGKNQFKALLTEYAARSGNKVVFNFINPNKSDTAEKDAMRNGIQPVMVSVREKDEMKKQQAFLGAIVKYGDKTDIISFIQPGGPMEYTLSTSIKKLTIDKKPYVGFLQGNGEPPIQAMQQLGQTLNILYNFQPVNLTDTAAIPENYKTLVLVDPRDTFKLGQLNQLDRFLKRGGNIAIAYSGLQGNLQEGSGKAIETGLAGWLSAHDIIMKPKFIIDAHCGNINVQQKLNGTIPYTSQVPFPYLPIISNFADHPITKGLSSVMFPFVTPIGFIGDTNKVKYIPLLETSDKTGMEDAPVTFEIQKQWNPNEFRLGNLIIGGALSGVDGNKDSKMVIIGCSDFATNGTGQQAMQQEEDNINLLANSVDWLSDDTGLIELRAKVIKVAPLKDIQDSTKILLKYLNFLLPLLLVIIYGAVRMQIKRKVRTKRMEETYD
ncbi:MAG TPA: Gldg family protein [Bacteroidia bacterium]|nr:Gldg family protein [Bacteroidia bacterium]